MSTHGLLGTSYRRPRGTRHGKATAWNSIRCDMKQIVLIIGHICSGKSRLARDLARDFGFRPVKTSEVVRRHAQERRRPTDRLSLQALGDELDRSTSGGGVSRGGFSMDEETPPGGVGVFCGCAKKNDKKAALETLPSAQRSCHT